MPCTKHPPAPPERRRLSTWPKPKPVQLLQKARWLHKQRDSLAQGPRIKPISICLAAGEQHWRPFPAAVCPPQLQSTLHRSVPRQDPQAPSPSWAQPLQPPRQPAQLDGPLGQGGTLLLPGRRRQPGQPLPRRSPPEEREPRASPARARGEPSAGPQCLLVATEVPGMEPRVGLRRDPAASRSLSGTASRPGRPEAACTHPAPTSAGRAPGAAAAGRPKGAQLCLGPLGCDVEGPHCLPSKASTDIHASQGRQCKHLLPAPTGSPRSIIQTAQQASTITDSRKSGYFGQHQ